MNIQFLGHSCFIVTIGGKSILFDPFITGNPLNETTKIDNITCDLILVTHGHADHCADAEKIARQNDCTIVSNYEVVNWFGQKDIKGHPLNHGGMTTIDGIMIKYVNAIHTSSMPDGSYGGNPGGFVIWTSDECLYFAGDTALTLDMKLIPMTCPKLTAAILPIGDNFTMGYEDAAIAAQFVECDKIVGCHFDTFGYIEIDHSAAKQAFEAKGKSLHLLGIEESIEL
jgi:L-ascorbate metabolism protein UlaG (beta-lactamase superfamily)